MRKLPAHASSASANRIGPVEARLGRDEVLQLADRCAPTAPASTLASIAKVESGWSPLVIRVNGVQAAIYHPRSAADAGRLAADLIGAGRNVDLGLAQINGRNLARLGMSVADAFDPCRSLAGAAWVLNQGYARALTLKSSGRPLLQTAYSIYNTGNRRGGFQNGYSEKIVEASRTASVALIGR